MHLLRFFSTPNQGLITIGPYRLVRHPRYLALFLTRIAFALAFASAIEWGLVVVWAVIVRRRIRIEEAYLVTRYNVASSR